MRKNETAYNTIRLALIGLNLTVRATGSLLKAKQLHLYVAVFAEKVSYYGTCKKSIELRLQRKG